MPRLALTRPVYWLIFLSTILVTGCSGTKVRPAPSADLDEPAPESGSVAGERQSLFKVQYSGPEGSGSLRLVLRTQSREDFQLSASDTLGRPLWSMEILGSVTVFVDYREKVFCRTEEEMRLAEVTLSMFSLHALPGLLMGQPPIDLDAGSLADGSTEYRDGEGRRWSIRTEGAELIAWTLWAGDAPSLWWTRQNKGGILSHRDGSQFRWRQVVEEPLGSSLTPLKPPEDFRQVTCNESNVPEFRQDQPPSPGGGPEN